MKTKIYTLLAISALGLSTSVFAGEGGIAGSLAYQFDGTTVTNASAAIAVGKTTAYAGAVTDAPGGTTEAFAVGTGGKVTLGTGSPYIADIAEETTAGLAINQANSLNATDTIMVINKDGTMTQILLPSVAPILP
jgi:hypothetical protein